MIKTSLKDKDIVAGEIYIDIIKGTREGYRIKGTDTWLNAFQQEVIDKQTGGLLSAMKVGQTIRVADPRQAPVAKAMGDAFEFYLFYALFNELGKHATVTDSPKVTPSMKILGPKTLENIRQAAASAAPALVTGLGLTEKQVEMQIVAGSEKRGDIQLTIDDKVIMIEAKNYAEHTIKSHGITYFTLTDGRAQNLPSLASFIYATRNNSAADVWLPPVLSLNDWKSKIKTQGFAGYVQDTDQKSSLRGGSGSKSDQQLFLYLLQKGNAANLASEAGGKVSQRAMVVLDRLNASGDQASIAVTCDVAAAFEETNEGKASVEAVLNNQRLRFSVIADGIGKEEIASFGIDQKKTDKSIDRADANKIAGKAQDPAFTTTFNFVLQKEFFKYAQGEGFRQALFGSKI